MKQYRLEVRRVHERNGDPRLSGGWELYVDSNFAGSGPESSYELIEEMAMLHTMVAAHPDEPSTGRI